MTESIPPPDSHPVYLTRSSERMLAAQAVATASGTDLAICATAADVIDLMSSATLLAVGVTDPGERRAVLAILWSVTGRAVLLMLALVLGLAGCGGHGSGPSGGPPSVADLASRLGCAHVQQNTEVIGVREEASCDLGADNLTIDTFTSNAQRDATEKAFGQLAGGVPVLGDRWVVLAPTQASAEAVRAKLGGQIR